MAINANIISASDIVTNTANVRDYWRLLKPGVMSLVVFTATIGLLAAPGQADSFTALLVIIAIALGSGGGAAINMWYDADIDRIMARTQKRPIPSGRIAEGDVLAIGLCLSTLAVMLLGLGTNWAAAGLLAFAIWFYACFYTMMLKRHTVQNIVIGGAAGAFPPVIGWLAVSPIITIEPFLYFLIIFLWTPPHFWALALHRNQDYTKAAIPMLPAVKGTAVTLRHIVGYSILLVLSTIALGIMGQFSWLYLSAATGLGGIFLYYAFRLCQQADSRRSMQLFGYSIIYLFLLFFAILIDKLIFGSIIQLTV